MLIKISKSIIRKKYQTNLLWKNQSDSEPIPGRLQRLHVHSQKNPGRGNFHDSETGSLKIWHLAVGVVILTQDPIKIKY